MQIHLLAGKYEFTHWDHLYTFPGYNSMAMIFENSIMCLNLVTNLYLFSIFIKGHSAASVCMEYLVRLLIVCRNGNHTSAFFKQALGPVLISLLVVFIINLFPYTGTKDI